MGTAFIITAVVYCSYFSVRKRHTISILSIFPNIPLLEEKENMEIKEMFVILFSTISREFRTLDNSKTILETKESSETWQHDKLAGDSRKNFHTLLVHHPSDFVCLVLRHGGCLRS
jgi:hypothetical protein